MKTKWPKEAPVFRVTEGGPLALKGAVGVGVFYDPNCWSNAPGEKTQWPGINRIGLQLLSGIAPGNDNKHPKDGWHGAYVHVSILRPLTPAARAMLALAKHE